MKTKKQKEIKFKDLKLKASSVLDIDKTFFTDGSANKMLIKIDLKIKKIKDKLNYWSFIRKEIVEAIEMQQRKVERENEEEKGS